MYGKELSDKYLATARRTTSSTRTTRRRWPTTAPRSPCIRGCLSGTLSVGGNSTRPTNLKSFCGGFVNMVFIVSSMLSGACATPEFLMYMNYFIEQEYGEDYYKRADEVVDLSTQTPDDRQGNHRLLRTDRLLDQPAHRARATSRPCSGTSPTTTATTSKACSASSVFPDGSQPRLGVAVVAAEAFHDVVQPPSALKTVLTFPVETMALLTKDGDVMDREWGDITAQMYAEGHSFFTYISDNADSLSIVLPPAQRDSGQRVQLHARRGRRLDRLEERADDQPQPLHPVRREATACTT